MNNQDVLERVSMIVESDLERTPFDKDIAKALGLSPANYSNMKKKGHLPLEPIVQYCALKKVNINWVLFEQNSAMLEESTEGIFQIKFFQYIKGSAGGGAFNEEAMEFSFLNLDKSYAETLGVSSMKNIEAIRVQGDSMEPTIKDNSIIVLDRGKVDIHHGGIFVLNVSSGTLIKRVSLNSTGGIDLISDNKELYTTQTFPLEEVSVIGKVIGALEKL